MQILKVIIAFAIFAFVIYQGVGLAVQIKERAKAKKLAKQNLQSSVLNDESSDSETSEGGDNK